MALLGSAGLTNQIAAGPSILIQGRNNRLVPRQQTLSTIQVPRSHVTQRAISIVTCASGTDGLSAGISPSSSPPLKAASVLAGAMLAAQMALGGSSSSALAAVESLSNEASQTTAPTAAIFLQSLPRQLFLAADVAPSPYTSTEGEATGLLDGRIRACPLSINPNCVSTSSLDFAYASPWEVPQQSAGNAVKRLESAVLSSLKKAKIEESRQMEEGYYIRATVDGLFARDTVELLLRDNAVFYRSLAGRVVYLYPFTTPITDFDAQRKRMEALGGGLEWLRQEEELGCQLAPGFAGIRILGAVGYDCESDDMYDY